MMFRSKLLPFMAHDALWWHLAEESLSVKRAKFLGQ